MTTIRRSIVLVVLAVATSPAVSPAQAPQRSTNDPCFRARPMPECGGFYVTNAGAYVTPTPNNSETPLRAIVDWGLMKNISPDHAIGGSWFLTFDEDELTTGPVFRYRRWFSGYRSLDLALGTVAASGSLLKAGSLLGLVKYNPVNWFGVGVRPELVRRSAFECDPSSCRPYTATSARIWGGAEFGSTPGAVLTLGGGVVLGILIILLVSASDD